MEIHPRQVTLLTPMEKSQDARVGTRPAQASARRDAPDGRPLVASDPKPHAARGRAVGATWAGSASRSRPLRVLVNRDLFVEAGLPPAVLRGNS